MLCGDDCFNIRRSRFVFGGISHLPPQLKAQHYADEAHRSWIFRSVGYGNDLLYWKDIISALRLVGYDYAISIEHEDSLMSQNEGLMKAVETLKSAIIFEPKMTETRWI